MELETDSGTPLSSEILFLFTNAPQVSPPDLHHPADPYINHAQKISECQSAYCPLRTWSKSQDQRKACDQLPGMTKRIWHLVAIVWYGITVRCSADGGHNLYSHIGKWKKPLNAVAHKLAVAMYYMMLNGQLFSYQKTNYHSASIDLTWFYPNFSEKRHPHCLSTRHNIHFVYAEFLP